jgi:NADPH2 dehydrogenase
MGYLNQPLENGKLPLKNRLVMPPMATAKSEADGRINQDILNYYDEKTKGGYISLVIVEHSYVSIEGKAGDKQVRGWQSNI